MATKYKKPEPVMRIPFAPKYPPSSEQEVIFDAMQNTNDHLHIDASAGSGKSTTLKWAMTKDKSRDAGMLAFSKAIVTEIEPECASHVTVKTAHSFGYGALAKRFGRLFLSNGKTQKIFKEEFPSLNPDNIDGAERGAAYGFMFDFLKLVDMLRANLADEKDINVVSSIADKYGLDNLDISIVMDCLPAMFKKMLESTNVIDFTDMIYMPLRLNLEIPSFSTMYVDERQDLNSMMIEYVFRMTRERVITCGDENQSIFGFAGADTKSTQRLIQKFQGQELPLNVCYRCGTDIVALAQTIYPKILPYDKNPTGIVRHDLEEINYDMPDGSMILSRRNANLVKPCFKLLRMGRKAIIKGKDIGAAMLKIVKSLKASDTIDLIDKIKLSQNSRVEKLLKKTDVNQAMIDRINDECECLIEIAMGCDSVEEIEKRINQIFDESTQGITLSSAHRSKGLEADYVTIIDYSRIRLAHKNMSEEDHLQESNLHYVSITRAKKQLDLVIK